jgi:hypothetical protein
VDEPIEAGFRAAAARIRLDGSERDEQAGEVAMRNTAERILWFVTGVGIGAGATFLFGTREGRKYRRQMARMVEDRCEQIGEASREVIDKGKEFLETGREFVEETGRRVGARLHVAGR